MHAGQHPGLCARPSRRSFPPDGAASPWAPPALDSRPVCGQRCRQLPLAPARHVAQLDCELVLHCPPLVLQALNHDAGVLLACGLRRLDLLVGMQKEGLMLDHQARLGI